jgi:hypothetical protein
MNCYEHPESVSVATCTCGRGLCQVCQGKRQPPMCDPCHAASVEARIATVQKRLVINGVFGVAYLVLGVADLIGTSTSTPSNIVGIAYILAAIWGFLGFRWLLDGVLGATRLAIFASAQSWLIAYFIGSLACSFAGFVVLPILIGIEVLQLKGLKAERTEQPAIADAGAVATVAT